jgi:hypothetical protein
VEKSLSPRSRTARLIAGDARVCRELFFVPFLNEAARMLEEAG